MADGITLNVNKAQINSKSLEGIGLSPADNEDKLFKTDAQSELIKAVHDLPASLMEVLEDTLSTTNQSFLDDIFSKIKDSQPEEPKAHFQKPSEKENDVKKLASKYGTPALYLGAKIDDIIKILKKPIEKATKSENNPVAAAGVIVLGSNIQNSKKYIKEFQELTEFISKQKVPDIGVFKDTQKKLDDLSNSMKETTETEVDEKKAKKFTQQMGTVTASFGDIVKQVIKLNILTSLIDFDKAGEKLKDLQKYAKKLGPIGESFESFGDGMIAIKEAAKTMIKAMPIFIIARVAIKPFKKFIEKMGELAEELKQIKLSVPKTMLENFKRLQGLLGLMISAGALATVMAPLALTGCLGLLAGKLFIKLLSSLVNTVNDNIDQKTVRKGIKVLQDILVFTSIATVAMIVISLVAPLVGKALLGTLGIAVFGLGLGFTLKILGNMSKEISKGIVSAILITVFAALAFLAIKLMSLITPKMTGNAMIALLGFIGVGVAAAGLGLVATYAVPAIALGCVLALTILTFAALTFLSMKVMSMIDTAMIQKSLEVFIGDGENAGLFMLYTSIAPLALVAPIALAAMLTAMPTSLLLIPFAIQTLIALKVFDKIENASITHAKDLIFGTKENAGLISLFATIALLSLVAVPAAIATGLSIGVMTLMIPFAILAKLSIGILGSIETKDVETSTKNIGLISLMFVELTLAMPFMMPAAIAAALGTRTLLTLVPFALLSKLNTGILGSIDPQQVLTSIENIGLLTLLFGAVTLAGPFAYSALFSLPMIITALSLSLVAAIPFKLMTALLGDEAFYNADNPLKEKAGLLGFINAVTYAMTLLGLVGPLGLPAIFGANFATAMTVALLPSILVFSKLSKFFAKKAPTNLVDIMYGNNLTKPETSSYGIIAFIAGSIIAAKTLSKGALSFVGGTLSALLSSLFFSVLSKSLKAMDDLIRAASNNVNVEAVRSYLELMEEVAQAATAPSLMSSLRQAVNNQVASLLKTTMADTINSLTGTVEPMRNLCNQVATIDPDKIRNLKNLTDSLEVMGSIGKISIDTNQVNKAINAMNTMAQDASKMKDGTEFSQKIAKFKPGFEALSLLPDKEIKDRANNVKSAVESLNKMDTSKLDSKAEAIERIAKAISSLQDGSVSINATSTTAKLGTTNMSTPSSSSSPSPKSRDGNSVDLSKIETYLQDIKTAVEQIKNGKPESWTNKK